MISLVFPTIERLLDQRVRTGLIFSDWLQLCNALESNTIRWCIKKLQKKHHHLFIIVLQFYVCFSCLLMYNCNISDSICSFQAFQPLRALQAFQAFQRFQALRAIEEFQAFQRFQAFHSLQALK
jgi:hypothetical protein